MPRSLLAAIVAAVLVLSLIAALPGAAHAAEPEEFLDAAAAAGLACEEYAPTQFLCSVQTDERYWYSNVDVFGELDGELHLTVGRILYSAESQPVEPDVLGLMTEYLGLLLDGEAESEALSWLARMNDGPQASGELQAGDWSLVWWTASDAGTFSEAVLTISYLPQPAVASPSALARIDWAAGGTSTYTGTWTVTAYASDYPYLPGDAPQYSVGDSWPGTLVVECGIVADYCNVTATSAGEYGFAVGAEVLDEGRLRQVIEEELSNCPGGQVRRDTYEVSFGSTEAVAENEEVSVPRTCEDAAGTLFAEDVTWSFEGVLTDYVPPATSPGAGDDLVGYLSSYGLECTHDGDVTVCERDVMGDDGLDATYTVTIRVEPTGEVVAIDGEVISVDASLPSDAVGFLRGVLERSPLPDEAEAAAWFDTAVAGEASTYESEGWRAGWSRADEEGGIVLALVVARLAPAPTLAAPSAAPSVAAGAATDVNRPREDQSFVASVPQPAEISTDPVVLLQSAALAALLVFLMPFPSQLFNSTLETHEDEVRRWFRLDRVGAAAAGIGAFWASWPGVAIFTVLAALLYGFLDPGFGLHLGSLATFLGMLLGIVLVTAAFAVPAILAHRRHGDRPSPKVVPVSLLIGVACVLLSRLTDFQPGYLYGLLIGLAFARELSNAEEGRATALGAGLMLSVAFGAWLALGVLPAGEGFGLVVARTALAALMVAGLEGVVFGLLPMRFLPGEPLYTWNRVLWGALLAAGAFAFFHILINPASGYLSDTSRTPLFTVLGLLLGFTLVSVAFWGWFRFRPGAPPAAGGTAT